jgi:hypothetical protein
VVLMSGFYTRPLGYIPGSCLQTTSSSWDRSEHLTMRLAPRLTNAASRSHLAQHYIKYVDQLFCTRDNNWLTNWVTLQEHFLDCSKANNELGYVSTGEESKATKWAYLSMKGRFDTCLITLIIKDWFSGIMTRPDIVDRLVFVKTVRRLPGIIHQGWALNCRQDDFPP